MILPSLKARLRFPQVICPTPNPQLQYNVYQFVQTIITFIYSKQHFQMLFSMSRSFAKRVNPCQLINFTFGKVRLININKIKQPQKQSINDIQIDAPKLESLGTKQAIPHQESENPMDKLYHTINRKIKNTVKLRQIFSIQKTNKHKMTLDQHLSLLLKLIYVVYANEDDVAPNQQKILNYLSFVKTLILKDSITPQQQIQFLNITSKSNNIFILKQLVPICEYILLEFDEKSFQLIPIVFNIKLLFSLIRITSNVGKQKSKPFLKTLRTLISYINQKKHFPKIQTTTIFNMIQQYVSLYPSLVLSSQNVKFLVQEMSKRKPNIGACLITQKLILTHLNYSILKKEILNTKPENMQYNIVFRVNRNLSKTFTLPKLISNKVQDIPICIYEHFQFLSSLGVEELSKLNLMSEYYNQIIASFEYLKKIYRKQISKNDFEIAATFRLFGFLLTDTVLQKMPPGLVDKIIKNILNQLYSNFTSIGKKQVQVLLVQLSLRRKFSNSSEVINIFLDALAFGFGKFQRKLFIPFYVKLLKYPSFISNPKSQTPTKTILKRFLHHIEEYKEQELIQMGENIKCIDNKDSIVQVYKESSIYNMTMPKQVTEENILALEKPNFRVRKYLDDEEYFSNEYSTRMIIRKKIANCLRKVALILTIVGDNEETKNSIRQIFLQEWKLFRYTQLYSYEDIENIISIYKSLEITSDLQKQRQLLNFQIQKMSKMQKQKQ